MPTRRGLALLGSGLALVVSGRLLALAELGTTGMALIAFVVAITVWVLTQALWARRIHLQVTRGHPASNVFANRPFPVTLQATAKRHRIPLCSVSEFAGSPDTRGLSAASSGARRTITAGLCRTGDLTYQRTLARGPHNLGPGRVTVVDSLGIARIPLLHVPTTRVEVWPDARLLEPHTVRRLFLASPSGDENEPGDLRPYVVGDDLRHVHWPTSARADALMVRDLHRVSRFDRTNVVIIDMASTSQGRNFELALSVAASLLLSTATHESVVLELDGPSGPSRYTGVAAALTALSGAVADRATEAGGVTAVANWNSGIVIAGEGTLIPRYARGPVIRCTATPPTGSAVPGQVVIHVASLDDLEEALEAGLNLTPRRRAHPTP